VLKETSDAPESFIEDCQIRIFSDIHWDQLVGTRGRRQQEHENEGKGESSTSVEILSDQQMEGRMIQLDLKKQY